MSVRLSHGGTNGAFPRDPLSGAFLLHDRYRYSPHRAEFRGDANEKGLREAKSGQAGNSAARGGGRTHGALTRECREQGSRLLLSDRANGARELAPG